MDEGGFGLLAQHQCCHLLFVHPHKILIHIVARQPQVLPVVVGDLRVIRPCGIILQHADFRFLAQRFCIGKAVFPLRCGGQYVSDDGFRFCITPQSCQTQGTLRKDFPTVTFQVGLKEVGSPAAIGGKRRCCQNRVNQVESLLKIVHRAKPSCGCAQQKFASLIIELRQIVACLINKVAAIVGTQHQGSQQRLLRVGILPFQVVAVRLDFQHFGKIMVMPRLAVLGVGKGIAAVEQFGQLHSPFAHALVQSQCIGNFCHALLHCPIVAKVPFAQVFGLQALRCQPLVQLPLQRSHECVCLQVLVPLVQRNGAFVVVVHRSGEQRHLPHATMGREHQQQCQHETPCAMSR